MTSILSTVFILLLSTGVWAAEIECKASYKVITPVDTRDEEEKPLALIFDDKRSATLEVDFKDRRFSVSVNKLDGDVLFSQTWGGSVKAGDKDREEDYGYSDGVISRAAFTSAGRLSLSTLTTIVPEKVKGRQDVSTGTALVKLECVKSLASSFPNQ